jgi:hypothetical protein
MQYTTDAPRTKTGIPELDAAHDVASMADSNGYGVDPQVVYEGPSFTTMNSRGQVVRFWAEVVVDRTDGAMN